MAIVFQGANPTSSSPSWTDTLSPLAKSVGANIRQNRQQQENIAQGSILNSVVQEIANRGENATFEDVLSAIAGGQQRGLNPESGKNISEQYGKIIPERLKARQEQQKKLQPYEEALGIIKRQREIADTGHIGPIASLTKKTRPFGSNWSGEGQRLREEYKQNGKRLVQAAAPLKITNRAEFQHYAEGLEDPSKSIDEVKGILDSMERIVKGSLQKEQGGEGGGQEESPEVLGRSQNVKTIQVRQKSTGRSANIHPSHIGEYSGHPDFEILESELDRSNQ